MENKSNTTSKEGNSKITYNVERTNLRDFGYAKSGNVQGDPDVYASYLEEIINGSLVEENHKGLTERERNEKRDRIKKLEEKLTESEKNNEKIEVDLKSKEKQIEEHRKELLQIREKRAENREELVRNSFSSLRFYVNLFILIFLSGYLFFFYVSAAYKALYIDQNTLAENISQGIGTGSIMPQPYELTEAIRYNYLLFLVPFVFYAFGWAFHILLDLKHQAKFVLVGLLIALTFTVDMLLALQIHANTESAKELMGLHTVKWSQNPTFYIILFLGFLVYIIWSILLDSLLREWRKRQVTINLKRIVKHLRKDIKILQAKLMPVDPVKQEILFLKDEVNTLVEGNIKGYIDQFSNGWISYLTPENLKSTKDKCLNIKEEILDKYNIKPGIVKIVKSRKK
jgi:hypothetical protein